MNFQKADGYWSNDFFAKIDGQKLILRFDNDDDDYRLTRSTLLAEFKCQSRWRVGGIAKRLNACMEPLAKCAAVANFASTFAKMVAEAAEDRATIFEKGRLCKVPCLHYRGALRLAVVRAEQGGSHEVALCADGRVITVESHKLKRTRETKSVLSRHGVDISQTPVKRTTLTCGEMWECPKSSCLAVKRGIQLSEREHHEIYFNVLGTETKTCVSCNAKDISPISGQMRFRLY